MENDSLNGYNWVGDAVVICRNQQLTMQHPKHMHVHPLKPFVKVHLAASLCSTHPGEQWVATHPDALPPAPPAPPPPPHKPLGHGCISIHI